jgi:hypothetical protein
MPMLYVNQKTDSLPCRCVRVTIDYYIPSASHTIKVLRTDTSGDFIKHSHGSRQSTIIASHIIHLTPHVTVNLRVDTFLLL